MPNLIPQTFINDLLAQTDIVEVIGARLKLRKAGSNYNGLCPFHSEKTPSFTVSQSKQFFHCFGCGAHGSAIGFLMQFEHLGFIEAVEALAAQKGLIVPHANEKNDQTHFNALYELQEQISKFYCQQLKRSSKAINYLKSRGLTGQICKQFGIGYAPNDWHNLANKSHSKKLLVTAGLLIDKNTDTFARFRDRIMFPIRDNRGRIIGFGGRTLGKDAAKYLNSPETPIYHKGNELYGLYEAKQANRQLDQLIVVEGYMDVIALAQNGITNVVATSGTAITPKQIQILLHHTPNIIFCFDGDQAGRTAAWRALENILAFMHDGTNVRFLFLPAEHDPDSLIRKIGKDAFNKLLAETMSLADFFFKHLATRVNIQTIEGKAKLTKDAELYIKKMPRGVFQQLLLQKLSELVQINIEKLHYTEPPVVQENKKNIFSSETMPPKIIQTAIKLLLHKPQLIECMDNFEDIKTMEITGINILQELIFLLKEQPNLSIGAILEYWRGKPGFVVLANLATIDLLAPETGLKKEFLGTIALINQLCRQQQINSYLHKANVAGLTAAEKIELQQLIVSAKTIDSE
jgi:DNA primase